MVVKGNTFFPWITPACVTHREWGFREVGTGVSEPKLLRERHSSYRGGETEASGGGQGCLRGSSSR